MAAWGHWLTIEVQHGVISADVWRRVHAESLVEAAVTNGALSWAWHVPRWGVVLELAFADEAARDGLRALPAVTAALDAVPDPVAGVRCIRAGVAVLGRGRPADRVLLLPRELPWQMSPRDRFLDLAVD